MFTKTAAVENIVSEYHRTGISIDEFFAEQECLSQSIRGRLNLVLEMDTKVASIAEQALEVRKVSRGGDDQNVTDACKHQRGQRIVDHRFVIYR